MPNKFSRRDVLKTSAAVAASAVFAQPLRAAGPEAASVTPALIEAARKEGKIAFYSALELNISEKLARTFEARTQASPRASSAPAPSAYSSASIRNRQATSPAWIWCAAPIRHISSTGTRRIGWRPT